jgi:hypothetical protein
MDKALDIATMLVVVAGIMVLVRPHSQGPGLVTAIGNAFSGSIATATGAIPNGYTNAFG